MTDKKDPPTVRQWVTLMASYLLLIVFFGLVGWGWAVASLSVALGIASIGLTQAILRNSK